MTFEQVSTISNFLANLATIIALPGILISYIISKKQIHFSTIEKCINDYRQLYHKYEDKYDNPKFLGQYLDLVNEELFYIEKGYLPKEVAEEWIDGMIDYLPFFYKSGIIESRKFNEFHNSESIKKRLYSYPRILKFINVREEIDFEKIFLPLSDNGSIDIRFSERKRLIKLLKRNLKKP